MLYFVIFSVDDSSGVFPRNWVILYGGIGGYRSSL